MVFRLSVGISPSDAMHVQPTVPHTASGTLLCRNGGASLCFLRFAVCVRVLLCHENMERASGLLGLFWKTFSQKPWLLLSADCKVYVGWNDYVRWKRV